MVESKKIKSKKHFLKRRKINLKKGLSFLPHLFTLGNVFFGFCSVIFAAKGDLFAASYCILLGALMDALDGRIARLIGSSSDFGVQLDSLADAISFCLAPAILYYFWQLKAFGLLGIIISSLFLLSGLMRLARFNIIHEKQTLFFLGVPTTVAGCFLATLLLNSGGVEQKNWFLFFILFLVLALSFLMISSIRFPTFKRKLFCLHRNWYVAAFIVLFAIISVMQFQKVLLLLFLLYFSSAIIAALRFKDKN